MFAFFKNLFKKEKQQVTASSLLGDDFNNKVKKMVRETIAESKERINEDLKKYNIKI